MFNFSEIPALGTAGYPSVPPLGRWTVSAWKKACVLLVRADSLGQSLVLLLAFATGVLGQEYSFRFYGAAEGLQNLVVLSLAQDRAGYIWAGTEVGLYRYNGTRFQLMGREEGLPCSTEVHGLFVASDGALWANTCARIFRFDGQAFQVIPGIDTMLRGAQVMTDAVGGGILITTETGIYETSQGVNGSFSTHSYPLGKALAGKPMHGISRDGADLWFGCDQALCLEESGRISVFGKEHGLPEDSWDGIQITPDGSVWVRSPKNVYRRGPRQSRFLREKQNIASSGFWGALTAAQDGSIMIPTDQGVAIRSGAGWSVINRQRGLRTENAGAVLEDREGSVWIGLIGGGVARWIGRGVWESWNTSQGFPSDVVWNIRRDMKGALWVGTSLGLVRLDGPGRIRKWSRRDGLGADNVRWLAESSDGSIWAAMKPGGLARIDNVSGKVRRIGASDGLPCDPEDVFVDRRDRLWLPTGCGLFLNERPSVSNRLIRVKTPESFGRAAWKIIEDAQGIIWVTTRTRLWSLREGQWREHGRAEGILTENPYVMVLAKDGSIWLRHRYDAGIDRLELSGDRVVRADSIVPADLRAAPGTAFHGFDAFGNFWRGSTNGVSVLSGNTWTRFTTEDGLVWNDCDGEAFWPDPNGDVWLGTSGGLAHYHAQNGGSPVMLVADPIIAGWEILEPARLIRAELSSLNYRAEQLVHFAYRLDNTPWTDSSERNISISGLAPGKHSLEVRSRIRDEPFSLHIARMEFRVKPKWTETWSARLLALTSVLLAIIQFVRWRLSAAVRKQHELEAVVAARTAKLSEANCSLDETARQLRSSEDRLKNAERLAHVGHWDWNLMTNELSWSDEMFRISGIPRGYTPSWEACFQAVAYEDRERVQRWMRACLAEKRGDSIEFRLLRPNGDARTVMCTAEVSTDDGGVSGRMFGACQDVTDARRTEQEDFDRKKLESVGTLAGGIAHDFNNLLGGVVAQAELALAECASGLYPDGELKMIRDVAIRGSEIVRQLMVYAGKECATNVLVDVSRTVQEMLALLKVSVSKHSTLETKLDQDYQAVRASSAQLQQIMMNLVMNASEAIGDRDGVICITTKCVRVDLGSSRHLLDRLPPGDYVQLDVSDTGCGMSEETKTRIFDPFFTTKLAGHGLGLAVVDGIVRGLRGAIHVVSEPSKGTTFQVLIPRVEPATGTVAGPVSGNRESVPANHDLTVLVVEDEDPLRQPVVRMLRNEGFKVLEAGNGSIAINILRSSTGKIDLILLDLTIPGASSAEVVAEAARNQPDTRVILTSAYSQDMLKLPVSEPQICGFIRKPFQFGDLVKTLCNTLLS